MATVHQDYRGSWWEGPDYREFTDHFDSGQRQALIDDDLLAGRSVSLVPVAVVAAGALAMLLTVLATIF